MSALFNAIWRYRGFVASSIINEIKSRLARSRFGVAWIILQPLAQVLIFATVLSSVLAARLEGIDNKYAYAAYLMSGIICWSLFAEIVQRSVTVFIDSGQLLKKIQFPRIALPLIVVGSASINNVALMSVILLIFPILGFPPSVHYLWLPLLMMMTIALATGIGLILGTLNVFVRDVGQVMTVAIQFWFWVTPIVYPVSIVPDGFRATLAFNPVVPLVTGYQDVLVYGTAPTTPLFGVGIVTLMLLAFAMAFFRRASAEMVDVL